MSYPIRAAVHHAVGEPLAIEQVHLAAPGPGEVRVGVSAVAICHSDLTFIDGGWAADLPAVWGHEATGRVLEVGEGVGNVAVDDTVVATLVFSCGTCRGCLAGVPVTCSGHRALDDASPITTPSGQVVGQGMRIGAFAEQVVVHHSQVVAINPDTPAASASLLACGVITGVGAVTNTAEVERGASVVVIGVGGVGINVIQGARLAGASTIVAVDPNEDKHEHAVRFGATHAVSPATASLVDEVRALTEGAGADYVFVATGAAAALHRSQDLLAANGSLVLVGMPASGVTADYDPASLAAANQRILGSKMGGSVIAADIPRLVAGYLAGHLELDALVSGTYPLERINEAIDGVRDGSALRNVIVFP